MSSNTQRGSYRTDYRDEDCMKFTDADEAVLARLAREETARQNAATASAGNLAAKSAA